MHRLNGRFPKVRDALTIPPQTITSLPRTVKFRGWFLNDEDLLTEFRFGGFREIDYPFYHTVMHTDTLEMILESALRCEINLIIPSSFIDITNPAEENLVRTAIRNGLYVTQHHVEPMGVSWFGAEHYIRAHGAEGEAVSFITNRTRMLEIWRHYAERWAVYGDRVIWQLGLRGKADRAVWQSDASVSASMEERGGIITDAIACQYAIIRDVLGHAEFESTATLWMEGAELYDRGFLRVPDGTAVIFSDVGAMQAFGSDFYRTACRPGQHYGVYYHVAFWGDGPHLAEGCNPAKMRDAYLDAARLGKLYYSILNVTNTREVHRSVQLNARILAESPERFDLDAAMREIYTDIYGEAAEAVLDGVKRYFAAIGDRGDAHLQAYCARHFFHYYDHSAKPYPVFAMTDGAMRAMGLEALAGKLSAEDAARLEAAEERFAAVSAYFDAIAPMIPAEAREYFEIFQRLQARYMMLMARWGAKIYAGDYAGAADALREMLAARTVAAQGEFAGWYAGEKKVNVQALLARTIAKMG